MSRLLVTDPVRRPSAREILEILTIQVQEESVAVPPTENKAMTILARGLENVSLNTSTYLFVTSSGPTAEWQGFMLGVYKKGGTHNGCPYYKQLDTERRDGEEHVIYRSKRKEGEKEWTFGRGLDGMFNIKNDVSKTDSVPLTGWTCFVEDKFRDDPYLRISPDQPTACGEITISASGDAAAYQQWCVGVYTPTQRFSAGRQVFKHKAYELYLLVPLDVVTWSVQDSVEMKGGRMQSGCAPSLCPADPRARTSERVGYTSWIYGWYNGEARHGDITVKCSVHKY